MTQKQRLLEDIRRFKYQYIIGKVAGEDLRAKNGQWIAQKGEVITQEMIDAAELNGLLNVLIMDMKIF
jgi:hypothetical protein